jgi:membrane protein DedA with SNARE-associated domain
LLERIRISVFHLDVHDLIRHYGYPAIFFFLFIENFGIPVPGQAFFIVAIWLTAKGELQLLPVALTAFVASVLGGTVGFAIGRRGGHKVLQEYGRYIWITPERLAKAEGFFAQYGGGVIVLARFLEGLRQIYGILAGSLNISWRRFLLCNIAGASLWVAVWIGLLLWFGRHVRHIWEVFRENQPYLLLGVGCAAFLAAGVLHLVNRAKKSESPSAEPRVSPEGDSTRTTADL